jgi:hypothetical protein
MNATVPEKMNEICSTDVYGIRVIDRLLSQSALEQMTATLLFTKSITYEEAEMRMRNSSIDIDILEHVILPVWKSLSNTETMVNIIHLRYHLSSFHLLLILLRLPRP